MMRIGELFSKFINDELGKEYADRVLGQGTRRWTEMGFLSEEGAEEIIQDVLNRQDRKLSDFTKR